MQHAAVPLHRLRQLAARHLHAHRRSRRILYRRTIPQRVIAGTSLAAVATTGVSAGGMLLASGVVDLTSAALIAGAALGMAPLGAKATRMFNCQVRRRRARMRAPAGGRRIGGASTDCLRSMRIHALEAHPLRAGNAGGTGTEFLILMCRCMWPLQTLRKLLGYWLLAVAPLVPLKPLIFALFSAAPAAEAGAVDAAAAVASSGAAALPSSSSSGGPGGAAPALALPVPTPAAAAAAGGDGFGARQLLAQLRPLNPGPDTFLLATGCLAGFASGLLGIGGGTVVTPLMAVATGLPQVRRRTAKACMRLGGRMGLASEAGGGGHHSAVSTRAAVGC